MFCMVGSRCFGLHCCRFVCSLVWLHMAVCRLFRTWGVASGRPRQNLFFWASRDRACLGPLDDAPKVDFDRMSQLKEIFPCIQN